MNHQNTDIESENLALDNCEREPVHIPGRVQGFVAVIAIKLSDFEIICHSDNCEQLIGIPSGELMGFKADKVFTNRKLIHGIRGSLSLPSLRTQRERVGRFSIQMDTESEFDVALSLSGDDIGVLEFEPVKGPAEQSGAAVFQVRTMLVSLASGGGVETLLDSAVSALRKLTGFDRVMGYRFLSCGSGEVAAEHRSPGVEPFLGLRYPAYDIPKQVRKIMVLQPLRLIGDVDDPHSTLVSKSAQPIDLTMSHGRGVSEIHVEYLKNMGVRATMNVAIVVRGELWGLFAFHHYRPRRISLDLRLVCELFGQLFSMQIQQELEKEILVKRTRAASVRDKLGECNSETFDDTFATLWTDLAKIVDAHGLAIVRSDSIRSYGEVPTEEVIRQVVEMSKDSLFSTDNISSVLQTPAKSQAGRSAGALVIRISTTDNTSAVFFRNEVIHEVRWAGEPVKDIKYGPSGPRLTPRGSFDEYFQTMTNKSDPWSRSDLSAAAELQSVILEVIYRDVAMTSDTWRSQKKYQDVLIVELNHRVKNVLALVRSIARQTTDSSHSLENFTTSFENRIGALATAHDLIGGSGVQWASLEDLVRTELKPFQNNPGQSLEFSGPTVGLRADVAPVIALVIHELVSNASKHGALSEKRGQLQVDWKLDAGGLAIDWRETGIGELTTPSEQGFGLTLIERAVPFECKGEAQATFNQDGFSVRLWLPGEAIKMMESKSDSKTIKREPEVSNLSGLVKNVFAVDDNMILALEMEKTLKMLGCEMVESVPSVEIGLQQLARMSDYSVAIMDINLGESTSYELAHKAVELGIPVIFATGYDSKFDMPNEFREFEHLTKPISEAALSDAIRRVIV